MTKLAELRQQRKAALDKYTALADKDVLNDNEKRDYETAKTNVVHLDDQIKRHQESQELLAAGGQPVEGQQIGNAFSRDERTGHWRVPANAENDPYANDNAARDVARKAGTFEGSARSLVVGGMLKMCGLAGGDIYRAREIAKEIYGEAHPVTRALVTSSGAAGGFIVPPDYMNEIIELLRPMAVVRSAGPRVIPMPRGTMRLPSQASAATASYSAEDTRITTSQQSLQAIVASFKKLTALVPISNDMMRYADPAVDAFVRDDLVKVMALAEDYQFLFGDGTVSTPRGFLSFANGWVVASGGTAGSWSTTGNSTLAVNSTTAQNPLIGQNGGSFVTSNESYSETTVIAELAGAMNKLDSGNVPDSKRTWFFHPRIFNYLYSLTNSLGLFVFRDELTKGTLFGYPYKKSTQIPINFHDANSANTTATMIFLVEMTEDMIFDSMSLELAVSREGSYIDSSGNTQSAFANDETLIRAIAEHDHQIRHDVSVAVIQDVLWAPTIT